MNTCYIMIGASGSGKTTWVRKQIDAASSGTRFSADDYFTDAKGLYRFEPEEQVDALEDCVVRFTKHVANLGVLDDQDNPKDVPDIFVDNVNAHLLEISPYLILAQAHGWDVVPIHCTNRWDSEKGLDEGLIRRQIDRISNMKEKWPKSWPTGRTWRDSSNYRR